MRWKKVTRKGQKPYWHADVLDASLTPIWSARIQVFGCSVIYKLELYIASYDCPRCTYYATLTGAKEGFEKYARQSLEKMWLQLGRVR